MLNRKSGSTESIRHSFLEGFQKDSWQKNSILLLLNHTKVF